MFYHSILYIKIIYYLSSQQQTNTNHQAQPPPKCQTTTDSTPIQHRFKQTNSHRFKQRGEGHYPHSPPPLPLSPPPPIAHSPPPPSDQPKLQQKKKKTHNQREAEWKANREEREEGEIDGGLGVRSVRSSVGEIERSWSVGEIEWLERDRAWRSVQSSSELRRRRWR